MPERDRSKSEALGATLSQQVGAQETRKLKSRRLAALNVWSGFGVFGLIGWSVAGPTLLGALLGLWLDKFRPGTHSWTLALLVAGLCLGSLSAWHWVSKQDQAIRAAARNDGE
jgi:ATP synthase protein I